MNRKLEESFLKALSAAKKKTSRRPNRVYGMSSSDLHSINKEQKLYVIKAGKGFTTLGFDVAARWARGASEITGQEYDYEAIKRGTEKGYEEYSRAMSEGARSGRRSTAVLTPQLIGLEGKRVEVVDKHGERRRFIVGKSTGWMPAHLEISRRGSSGGPAVMGAPFKSVRVID